ncbi:ABC transporter substrate-binding protein [Acidipropionibacterium jensenii]|uniref:ABC transporter substrate-binding protein n=1 Tax=Acidipropionibacterium jensenii TaxID=1749 RepID=UPI002647E2BE|nr:ABC transporter substrate-binding protein [Acidipropionibacterium jensenii]MDN5976603.1 ABC transporter substrate-binding protein [Acidipropionibacterium jensenii]MDN5996996.1 ABC transporter substrate-binding protein [Acidipropionibacterium jensenii]MDN6426303.1 ABC transporter substrate-binding protein [Acidipropionibacterium jensenii]MDN6442112.1 ABC transporter substrate-binding protein [Acidipropionibacterium jensenii]MDN6479870.1 ABC transporter substrate-binding protein [Acidipropion
MSAAADALGPVGRRGGPARRWRTRLAGLLILITVVGWAVVGVVGNARGSQLSVLCSSIDDICQEWADAFTAETGIRVTMTRRSAGEALTLISQPGHHFDVWHGGPSEAYATGTSRGLFVAYRPRGWSQVPAFARDKEGYWTGTYQGILGFCSDRSVLARNGLPVPMSWQDLLNPRYRGLISAPNPMFSGTGYTMVETQVARLGGEQAGMDWLRRLNSNVLQYTSSGLAPSGVVARGEVATAITFTQHCVKQIEQGHRDLVVSYPREGTGREIGAVAILRGTDHRSAWHLAAARRYEDFILSAKGQELGGRTHSRQLPARADLPSDQRLRLPADRRIVTLPLAEGAQRREHLTEQFREQVLG